MKRILFSGDGSSGDLLPMVLMAREFKLAGYEVCVCGSSEFSKMAQDFDVPFEPYPHNYSEIYLEKQRTGYIHNIRENIRHQEILYHGECELLAKLAPQFDVLVNLAHELFVPSAAQAFGIPNLKLMTFPMVRSDLYGPAAGLPFVTRNKWVNRLEWMGVVVAARRFSYFRTVNQLRASLGLPDVGDLLGSVTKCDHMMMGVYEELVPPCPSWTHFDYSYIGPCIPRTDVQLSDELETFLAAGSKPIYIGFGSMRHANSAELTGALLQAAKDAGVRVILAQATSDIGSGVGDSDDLYVLREYPIPHHVLFPRCKAAVHHGSWITTHLAAQAGIPQVILPQASDQYFWGDVLVRKGLGPKWVDMNRLKLPKLSAAIEQLATRESYAINARALADRVRGIDGASNAVRLFQQIEGKLQKKTSVAGAKP